MADVMQQEGGFEFDLCRRNAALGKMGVQPMTPLKTGTTIAGVIFKVSGSDPFTQLEWITGGLTMGDDLFLRPRGDKTKPCFIRFRAATGVRLPRV